MKLNIFSSTLYSLNILKRHRIFTTMSQSEKTDLMHLITRWAKTATFDCTNETITIVSETGTVHKIERIENTIRVTKKELGEKEFTERKETAKKVANYLKSRGFRI